jgi:hypothetical protein
MTKRLWIVSLLARSAIRLKDDTMLNIRATPESTVPVVGIRLRNQVCQSTDGTRFVGALVAEAAGNCANSQEAAGLLANLANPYYQVMAVAANAAVDDPLDFIAYAPPLGRNDGGEFVIQRHSQTRAPAPVVRDLPVDGLMTLIQRLQVHLREDRVHRAMAHYRQALNNMAPNNWVLAGECLYLAVENLGRVVYQRLLKEADLPDGPESKHALALKHGLKPKDNNDRSHLGKLDACIREEHIFQGDRACYKKLVDASDGFEHGYMDFDKIRNLTDAVTRKAFAYVRRAILREIGVSPSSPLLDPKFDVPLGDWRPVLEVEGGYTDSAAIPLPDLGDENVTAVWPNFVGPTIIPSIGRVVDNDDGTRSIDLVLNADGKSLINTQVVRMTRTRWIVPNGKATAEEVQFPITRVVWNGEDVTERYTSQGSKEDIQPRKEKGKE